MTYTVTVKYLSSLSDETWFRYVQAVLLFAIKTFSVITETHTGILLVSMTDNSTVSSHIPTFKWSFEEKQFIISSYFWGYVFLILPGGYLNQRFGPKLVILTACVINTIVWVITPFVLGEGRWQIFCVLRAIQGITQSVEQSARFASISTWFTPCEFPLVGSLVSSGFEFGMIISTVVCGIVADSTLGWPGIYLIFGGMSVVLTGFWALFGVDKPMSKTAEKTTKIPWLEILSSPPFLALLLVTSLQEFGIVMTTLEVPLYFQSVFNTDVTHNLLICTIPQIASLVMSWILPYTAQILLTLKMFSLIQMRKLYTIMYVVITVIVYARFYWLSKSQKLEAEVLVVIAASSYGFYDIAYTTNIIDLSPNYAAILSSIMDLCTTLVQLIASLVLSQINVSTSNNILFL